MGEPAELTIDHCQLSIVNSGPHSPTPPPPPIPHSPLRTPHSHPRLLAGDPLHLATWSAGPEREPWPDLGFVFLHAIGLTHHSWEAAAGRVAREYPALALTLPGAGESDLPPDGDYSLAGQARRILAAARAHWGEQGPRRWVLVGNSLGGAVALAAAVGGAQEIVSLVLVNAAAYRQALPGVGHLGHLPGMHWLVRAAPRWSIRAGLTVGSGRWGWTTDQHGHRCQQAFRRPGGSLAFLLMLRALYGPELSHLAPRYPRLEVPALVLHGQRDPLIPRWSSARLAQEIPTARLVPLPNLGHFPQEEDPRRVAELCLSAAPGRSG